MGCSTSLILSWGKHFYQYMGLVSLQYFEKYVFLLIYSRNSGLESQNIFCDNSYSFFIPIFMIFTFLYIYFSMWFLIFQSVWSCDSLELPINDAIMEDGSMLGCRQHCCHETSSGLSIDSSQICWTLGRGRISTWRYQYFTRKRYLVKLLKRIKQTKDIILNDF